MKSLYKTIFLLFLNVSFVVFNSYGQVAPGIEWQNTIGGNNLDRLYSISQTADSGYICGGRSGSNISGDKTENSNGGSDYWIVKTNAGGNIQWQNTIGGYLDDYLYSISQTADGGFICGGYSTSDSSGDKTEDSQGWDYWVIKLDTSGNIQWENTIGGNDFDQLFSISQTVDGGYICGGHSRSNISGDKTENCQGYEDYWVVKLDGSGNIQWQNTIGGNFSDYLYSISQTADGGFICGGFSASDISGDKTENPIGGLNRYDYWVIKLDTSGNIQWQNTIGGSDDDFLYSISQAIDSGYICAGSSYSNISGDKTENNWDPTFTTPDYWVVKLDTSGNIQWQNTVGGNNFDDLYSISKTADGGYICGGMSKSTISGDKTENNWDPTFTTTDYWVVKLNTSGNIEWQNTLGGNNFDDLHSISQTADGGYICGGYSQSNISGDKSEISQGWDDYWIVKLFPDTITSISTHQPPTSNFQISPNPTTGIIHLTFNTKHNAPLACEILNVMGQTVFATQPETKNQKPETQLDLSFLPKGIYVLRINDSVNSFSKKLVIQ